MIGVVTVEEFPHGLRCANCRVDLPPGSPYTDTFDGFVRDTVACILICVDCEETLSHD